MRYLIAFGDTSVQSFESKNGDKAENLDALERDKYNVYSNFSKIIHSSADSGVIDIGWEQIEVLESSEKPAESLKESQWEIIESEETAAIPSKSNNQSQQIETVIYNSNLRQRLIDDLEELECFLKQRQIELSAKDQSLFNVYQDANIAKTKSQRYASLKSECDNQAAIQNILKVIAGVLSAL